MISALNDFKWYFLFYKCAYVIGSQSSDLAELTVIYFIQENDDGHNNFYLLSGRNTFNGINSLGINDKYAGKKKLKAPNK